MQMIDPCRALFIGLLIAFSSGNALLIALFLGIFIPVVVGIFKSPEALRIGCEQAVFDLDAAFWTLAFERQPTKVVFALLARQIELNGRVGRHIGALSAVHGQQFASWAVPT